MKYVDIQMTMDIIEVAKEGHHVGEVLIHICWGGYLEVRSNAALTYHGGRNVCVWLRKGMGIGNVQKLVEEAKGEWLGEHRLWYNTKYDWSIIFLVQGDADV